MEGEPLKEETGSDNSAFLSLYGTTLPRVERQIGEANTGKTDYQYRARTGCGDYGWLATYRKGSCVPCIQGSQKPQCATSIAKKRRE
jgi:hypothetical protein